MRRRPLSLSFECPLSLTELSPRNGGRDRWCEGCQRTVYDLSMRSTGEAKRLLRRARKRRVCVAYRVDAKALPVFRRATLDRVGVALAAAALSASLGCIGFVDSEWETEEPRLDHEGWDPPVQPYAPAQPSPPPSPPEDEGFELADPEEVDLQPESPLMSGRGRMGVVAPLHRREQLREIERREYLRELERQAQAVGPIVNPVGDGDSG